MSRFESLYISVVGFFNKWRMIAGLHIQKKSEEVPTTNLKPIQFKNQPQICINEIIGIKVGPSEFYKLMVQSYQNCWNMADWK